MIPIEPRILSQSQAFTVLGRKVAEDAIDAGWIQARATKQKGRGPGKKIYAVEDVRRVEERILNGEYPGN